MKIFNCPIESFQPDEKYDCIVMCDVLEHVLSPGQVLQHCYSLLNPGGIIYIQVPNLVGFKLPFNHSWGLPHHIWQFGKGSLRRLLEQKHFQVVGIHTGVLGIIGVYERGGPHAWHRLLWKTAHIFKIGNRLQMVAVKPD
jgi:SAM-dependent methyltransferase